MNSSNLHSIKLIFANVLQGFIFAGERASEEKFSAYDPQRYIDYFKSLNPDILCLQEVLVDNKQGKSEFVENFSQQLNLPYFSNCVNDKAWLKKKGFYGMTVLTKFPIKQEEFFKLPNAKLEVDRQDGSHWIMHDKVAQKVVLEVNDQEVNIFNLQFFPFHHFGRELSEVDFSPIRNALVDILRLNEQEPILVVGDFNNKDINLDKAFPEIFTEGKMKEAVIANTTYAGYNDQVDHILYTPKFFKLESGYVEKNYSDHWAVVARFHMV